MADSNDWMRRAVHEDAVTPGSIDTSRASAARVYDYHLGGKDYFAVDREAGDAVIEAMPDAQLLARDNRAFLVRAVRYLVAEAGIRQIVDVGSGLPTAGNVHEIAQEIDPGVRVVYVDKDPIVLAHARALLAGNPTTTVITADLREPDAIFDHTATRELVDLGQPFAVLLAGILHHLEDEEDPARIVARIRERLPSGGYLVIENFFDSGDPRARRLERAFVEGGLGTGRFRTWDEQHRYFTGLDMMDPGLVPVNDWRPDRDTPKDSAVHDLHVGGVAYKP